jgi:hypothetical protein
VGLNRLKNAKEKAKRASDTVSVADFKRQAKNESKGNKKAGHLVPLNDSADDGDPKGIADDGICDWEQGDNTAKCAAIELGEDNLPQECNPEKKNRGNRGGSKGKFDGFECDRWYETYEAGEEPGADADEAAEQLEATYEAMEDDLVVMNDSLDDVNAFLEQKPAPLLTASNGCEPPPESPPPEFFTAVNVLRLTKVAAFGAARLLASSCGQVVVAFGFGGNCRSYAAPFDAIALAADIAYTTADIALHDWESQRQTAILNCVGETAAALETMRQQIQTEHEYIEELLCTPQGRRPEWPGQP